MAPRIQKLITSKILNIRYLIPTHLRGKLYQIYINISWNYYYRKYLNTINSSSTIDGNLIRNLRYSWGNSGFSAKSEYINTLIKYSKKTDGLILECGSGLSTLLIAPIAKMKGIKMISLEHNEFWAN